MDISGITQLLLGWVFKIIGLGQQARVLCHRGFLPTNTDCYFVNVTNLSLKRDLEVTHVWFECRSQVNVLNHQRPVPRRLQPDESWETWIEAERIPQEFRENFHRLARVRLSNGRIIKSKLNRNVPSEGFVPGS